ncbi:hypothetical protein J1N35_034562 [Gossypium stocksii]|uniref:COP9 signalosome complex subunit 5 n=1 Tax=Gossypium stocksii TaxID=47602 RepID=A0A9D3ZQN3_9ROSI|nr:hypothetical protein J1N35_034562 [Gossypium stocksii]
MDSAIAQKTWELENNILAVEAPDPSSDFIFYYDKVAQAMSLKAKPWANDPYFFKRVKISALALLKMVIHARSGGTIEAGRLKNVVGWYHSHPGYGCWLSGIDVLTQMLNQQFQEPFLAVVIDPTRTVSAGKVDIGAFRTYPEGYKPTDDPISEYQTIPLNKIEDFGVHCKQYYALNITYFKSSLDCHLLDLLWSKYWVNTLSSSPLLGNGDYVAGLSKTSFSTRLDSQNRYLVRPLAKHEMITA